MRAAVLTELSGPDGLQIQEIPDPTPGPGQVLLRVRACGINFADVLITQGLYQEKPPLPFVPGMEVSGDILAVGEGVTHLRPGQRVAALSGLGGLAEKVVVSADRVVPIPDDMPYEVAAGFLVAYGTAHVGLDHRARLLPGEVVLVHGAAGGVGLAAVEVAKAMGATVIATASTPEKMELAAQHGADYTINYREEDFRQRVKELTDGRGADVVFDPVGGPVFEQSLRCIAWEGRLLVIGFASGKIPSVPAGLVLVKNCAVVGLYWGAYADRDPMVLTDSLATLFRWYEEGRLHPHVSATYPLEQAGDALRALQRREARGKIVVTP